MSNNLSISVILPIFNNLNLIKKNLEEIISQLTDNDELTILDDASTDKSKEYLIKKFNLKKTADGYDQRGEFTLYSTKNGHQKFEILLIVNHQNLRFAASCNRAVEHAHSTLLFLVNSDVIFTKGVLNTLRDKFKTQKKLFAIGCLEKEPNEGGILGGKNKLWFEKGLFHHSRVDNYKSGETAWASGGSAIFDKKKWQELGGFDEKYHPAYWEDIDLSTRAKKRGWKVLFLETAKVIHNHQSTNKNVFQKQQLQQLSWKHADYFTWKNGSIIQKLQFLLFRPYWWLKRAAVNEGKAYLIGFWLIIFLAIFLRFYRLAQIPSGMTWDEAAVGYNGYSVIKTRHDEWLNRLPISFKSFGDFKAPFAIYLVGLITTLLGLNLYNVRLPFAISGVLAVWGMVKLTRLLLEVHYSPISPKKNNIKLLTLASGFLLAISPWHLHFTRTGFESGLALTMIIWGVYLLAKSVSSHKKINHFGVDYRLLFATGLLASSLYTYHSSKIFLPLLLLMVGIIHHKIVLSNLKKISFSAIFFILLTIPLVKDSFFGEGLTRGGTLIFSQANSIGEFLNLFSQRLIAHLSPAFLIGGWTDTLRHGTQKHSAFLLSVFLFIVLGLGRLLAELLLKKKRSIYWLKISLVWILLGLLPAVLGDTFPQANRALMALPGFIWLALPGIELLIFKISNFFKNKNQGYIAGVYIILLAIIINFVLYLHHYYSVFAKESATDYSEGYLEAMQLAYDYERGTNGKPEVQQIVVSTAYGQPYIYLLFVRKTNPIWYQGGSLIKYLFVDKVSESDLNRDNSLIIATVEDPEFTTSPTHQVITKFGETRFRIYYTGE